MVAVYVGRIVAPSGTTEGIGISLYEQDLATELASEARMLTMRKRVDDTRDEDHGDGYPVFDDWSARDDTEGYDWDGVELLTPDVFDSLRDDLDTIGLDDLIAAAQDAHDQAITVAYHKIGS